MADYNPNTVSAYQQYASSMKAGGGGRNTSGLGSRTSTASMTTAPSGSVDFTTINPSTGQQKKVATIDYGSLQTEYGKTDGPAPISPAVIYHSAATAMADAGSVLTPPVPTADAFSLYSMPNMVQQVSDYVYRADRDMAVREAISGAQAEEQDSVDAAIKSINRAITQGKTDAEIAEAFLNDMGGMGSDKPDETGGFGVPGVTLKDVTDTQQGLMTNPQPLYDFADEMANPSITTTELPSITADQKEKLGAKLREASDKGDLSSVMNQLAQDSKVQLSSAVTNFIEGAETQVASNDIDPFTGLPFGNNELGFTDVSPSAEAEEQQGLMSRSRVPTGSIEEAVREVYGLEEAPAVDAVATDENFLETPTFKLLEGVEGFRSKPYSLNNRETLGGKPHKSGLTVGAGIDFGQHSEQTLLDMGIPKTMVDKAKNAGWIGLNPDTIVDPKTGEAAATRARGHELMYDKFVEQKNAGTLPTFTDAELSQATPPVYQTYEDAAKEQFENDTGLSFDDLNEGSKAVLTLEKYHRGVNYDLPEAMLIGAAENNPDKAAQGTKNKTRRKNLKDWLKKVGLNYETRRESSPRPMLRPTE